MAETWVFNNTLQIIKELSSSGEFTSNGETFSLMKTTTDGRLRFYAASGNYIDVYANNAWAAGIGDYKTVAFSEAPEKNFRSWLESNATLQEDTTVVEYLTTNIDLKKVANAIRAKGGTTAKLSFPDGFAQAINNISTGTGSGKEEEVVTVPLDMASGDQIITPSEGKTLSQVTVTKPDDLLPSRVVLGSNIGGVDGRYFAPEIWVLNEEITVPVKTLSFTDLAFLTRATSDLSSIQTRLVVAPADGKVRIIAVDAAGNSTYLKRPVAMPSGNYTDTNGWYGDSKHPQIGRILVFLQPTSGRSVQGWLRENAVLYGGDTFAAQKSSLFELTDVDFAKVLNVTANGAYSIKPNAPYSAFGSATVNVNVPVPTVQDTKALTITSNGTVSVTPDAPYDALKKVDVTVDVASGGGTETTSVEVYGDSSTIDMPIFCTWQTENGWLGTSEFELTSSNGDFLFTIPDVLVGGYIVFTKDPMNQAFFSVMDMTGVEWVSVNPMPETGDVTNASTVVKVVEPGANFKLCIASA